METSSHSGKHSGTAYFMVDKGLLFPFFESTVILVGDNLDFKILAAVKLARVFITDLV
jgi:hypothetical protein